MFPFPFIFTSLITHICFSAIENECFSQLRQISLTFSAHGPFCPCPSVYETRCPSWSSSKLTPSRFDEWKNMSLSLPVSINPKPLSVSRLMVPSGICPVSSKSVMQRCPKPSFRLLHCNHAILSSQLPASDGTCQRANLEPRRREGSARESAMHRSEVDVSPEPWEGNAGGRRSRAAVIEKPPFFCVSKKLG